MTALKKIALCICLSVPFILSLHANKIDSLKTVLDSSPKGMEKYNILRQLSDQYSNEQEETIYLKMMLKSAQKMDSINLQCHAMANLARNYYNRMIEDSLHLWTERVIPLAGKHQFYQYLFDAYSFECYLDIYTHRFESAMEKSKKLYSLAKQFNSKDGLVTSYENMGQIYQQTKRHKEAIKAYKQGLELQQQMGSRHGYQVQFIFNIIESEIELNQFDEVHKNMKEVSLLIDNFENGKYPSEGGFPIERCRWLAQCQLIVMYVKEGKFREAEKAIENSKQYTNVNDIYVKCYYLAACANYYQATKQLDKALEYIDQALAIDYNSSYLLIRANLLAESGQMANAVKQYQEVIAHSDSITNEEFSYQLNDLSTRHEVDRLASEAKEMQLESKQFQLKVLFASIVFLVVVLIIVILLLTRTKHLTSKLLISENQLRKEKNALMQSEKDLIAARDKAEEANHLKTAFLQNISHEIRTPLNAIIGFSNIISEKHNNEEDKQVIDIIKTNSNLLLQLIHDVLDLSCLESESDPFKFSNYNLNDCCRTAALNVKHLIEPNVTLHYPTSKEYIPIVTDGLRLQQVLHNLLTNAAKFTKQGEITLSYVVNKEKHNVEIFVTDTGCGIPKEKKDEVFKRFIKLDEFAQGTGLGLPIAQMITEKLHGTIELDTTYTKGARFVVTLPLESKQQ